MTEKMMHFGATPSPTKPATALTPSQTVGPFFHYMLAPHEYKNVPQIFTTDLTANDLLHTKIHIEGRVIDGDGVGIPDAMVEIWQANGEGFYAHPADTRAKTSNNFGGFGRSDTDPHGTYHFTTIKPGRVPGANGQLQAPHIAVNIFGRGFPKQLITRIYFEDEASNAEDAILKLVPDDRRNSIIAKRDPKRKNTYILDFVIQGGNETVFFDC